MALSDALAQFESLSVSQDVIRKAAVSASGTLADLFEFHKADYLAAGKRAYHHFVSLRKVIADSGLPPETTVASKITPNDCLSVLTVQDNSKTRLGESNPLLYVLSVLIWYEI